MPLNHRFFAIMNFSGNLAKMRVAYENHTIRYFMHSPEGDRELNPWLGKRLSLRFTGRINCISCGKTTKKSFGQGFCYNCFSSSADNAECIVRPELCRGHLGEGRDPQWELDHHVKPHVVYLACSGGIKVGVTRDTQIPTRWIDQGATSAIKLCETPNRYLAGITEVHLKAFFKDKTDWRKMLKNIQDPIDLLAEKDKAQQHLPEELHAYVSKDHNIFQIHYPVLHYPEKVQSLGFEKTPEIEGTLTGIKGQYLMLDGDKVLNIRNHSGYFIEASFES